MRTIWKFPIALTGAQQLSMPRGAQILSVAIQREALCLWAIVDPDADRVSRAILINGTGHPLPNLVQRPWFIGTVLTPRGEFVWHVFDGGEL